MKIPPNGDAPGSIHVPVNDVLRDIEAESCWDTDWTRSRLEQALSAIHGIARTALEVRMAPTADGGWRDINKP